MQVSSKTVDAAFQSCATWFPLVGRLETGARVPDDSWVWQPDSETWKTAAGIIGQLGSMNCEYSETIRDSIEWGQVVAMLPMVRIQFGLGTHFTRRIPRFGVLWLLPASLGKQKAEPRWFGRGVICLKAQLHAKSQGLVAVRVKGGTQDSSSDIFRQYGQIPR